MIRVIKTDEKNSLLGTAMLCVFILDYFGNKIKISCAYSRIQNENKNFTPPKFLTYSLWIFHLFIMMVVIKVIQESFGLHVETNNQLGALGNIFFGCTVLALIVKEAALLFSVTDGHAAAESASRELWGDIFLFSVNAIAFTATWSYFTPLLRHLHLYHGTNLISQELAASFMFFMFYLPLRIPYFMEETCTGSARQKMRVGFSLLVALFFALRSIY